MWPGPRPTCAPSFILIRPTVWPQYTNVTDRTDKQTGQRSDSIGRTVLQKVAQQNCNQWRQYPPFVIIIITLPLGGVWSITISVTAWMHVCLSARIWYLRMHMLNCTKWSVHAPSGRGSVLLWRQCNTLCTSDFVDDVGVQQGLQPTVSQREATQGRHKRGEICYHQLHC